MVSLGRWAPDPPGWVLRWTRWAPTCWGTSASPHKHAGMQTGFCKIHHSPSTGSLSNQPMSPGIQLSSFGETQKSIKIKMLGFLKKKKKKSSVQQSTMFNLLKTNKQTNICLQEAQDLAGVILIYKASEPFNSNYSERGCTHVLLAGFSHPICKAAP